jgi:hypothetical protein
MLTDFEWVCEQVLDSVKHSAAADIGWEDFIVRHLVTEERVADDGPPGWNEKTRKARTVLIYIAIEHLIQGKRIHPAPGRGQATGRRLLRPTNVLDSIVQSL